MMSSSLFVKIWFGNDFQAFLSKRATHIQNAHAFALKPAPQDPLRYCVPRAFLI